MASPSPICSVKDGAAAAVFSPPYDVTAGNVITIALVSMAGVTGWTLTLSGQDETDVPPAVTVNAVTGVATFTAPAAPWTLLYKSVVNGGNDVNGVAQSGYTTSVGVHCKTVAGARLMASNETTESNSASGWLAKINGPIRTGGIAGPAGPPGTAGSSAYTANTQTAAVAIGDVGVSANVDGTGAVTKITAALAAANKSAVGIVTAAATVGNPATLQTVGQVPATVTGSRLVFE